MSGISRSCTEIVQGPRGSKMDQMMTGKTRLRGYTSEGFENGGPSERMFDKAES